MEAAESTASRSLDSRRTTNHVQLDDSPLAPHSAIDREVIKLLQELTVPKFESISTQIISLINKSEDEKDGRRLARVAQLIFEAAVKDTAGSSMYARLCRQAADGILPNIVHEASVTDAQAKGLVGGQLFRKHLLDLCQHGFDHYCKSYSRGTAADTQHPTTFQGVELPLGRFGIIQLVGELFKEGLMEDEDMHQYLGRLLFNVKNPREDDAESACKLLLNVGSILDGTPQSRDRMDLHFRRVQELMKGTNINMRVRGNIRILLNQRARRWGSHPPTSIDARPYISTFADAADVEKDIGPAITKQIVENATVDRSRPFEQRTLSLLSPAPASTDAVPLTTSGQVSTDKNGGSSTGQKLKKPHICNLFSPAATKETQSPLSTARNIEDIHAIIYPEGIRPPSSTLNKNAPPGQFRYDRGFLLQFMGVSKAKPPNLGPVHLLGIDPVVNAPPLVVSGRGRRDPVKPRDSGIPGRTGSNLAKGSRSGRLSHATRDGQDGRGVGGEKVRPQSKAGDWSMFGPTSIFSSPQKD